MKATGIVRRMDDLGRVVIPKEIRRTMRIREGDPLEIYTASDGEVIFKKYSPMGELSTLAVQFAEVLNRSIGAPVLITDRDHVIAVCGASKRELLERRVAPELEELMEGRKTYEAKDGAAALYPLLGFSKAALVALPIIGAGDVSGSVLLLEQDEKTLPSAEDKKLMQIASAFLGKQTEE